MDLPGPDACAVSQLSPERAQLPPEPPPLVPPEPPVLPPEPPALDVLELAVVLLPPLPPTELELLTDVRPPSLVPGQSCV